MSNTKLSCPGSRRLSFWMAEENISTGDLSTRLGVTPASVAGWRTGKSRPKRGVDLKLERATSGFVKPDAWYTVAEKESAAAVEALP